jgi:23S rRNA (uracil1939-C5)-methyltransferase
MSFQVKIEKLAVGGYGVARHEGLVVFVPYSVPGDEVIVEITEKKSNHAFAEIKEFVTKSPERIEPPCQYYQSCGGCNWQHIQSEAQLRYKEDLVRENLRKFLGEDISVNKIIPSPQPWRYRNRVQLSSAEGRLGFKKRKSHSVVDIEDCLIIEEPLGKALSRVRTSLGPTERRIELFLTPKNDVKWETMENLEDAMGFSQVNRFQNEDLISKVLEWSPASAKSILELYAGSGNFTWPLAGKFSDSEIVAVELNSKLVGRAAENKKTFPKVQFINSDVESFLKRWPVTKHELVFMDPPRQGANPFIMKSLAAAGVPHILYLSCHPVSLARDLSDFMKAAKKSRKSYKITQVQPFEMFPHTDHVETLVSINLSR